MASKAYRLRLVALLALALIASPAHADGRPVAVLVSNASEPFEQATNAMVRTLGRDRPATEVIRLDLNGSDSNAAELLAQARQARPALIVTVGSLATATALAHPGPEPIVFSMVLYPGRSGYVAGRNVTGVALDVPLEVQFATLRALLPEARRLGVLYHRDETGPIVADAHDEAQRQGFALQTRHVERAADIPALLPSFLAGVDAVWTVADSHVVSQQTMPALILQALRMWVPVFGLSPQHARMGALAAYGFDYADIGAQTAELAARVLERGQADEIAVVEPRKLLLTINQRSADHLEVTLPPEVEQQASEVIR